MLYEVITNVTEPAFTSEALGVYVAVKVFLSGLKVPAPPVQLPEVAPPPTEPAKATGTFEQMVWFV